MPSCLTSPIREVAARCEPLAKRKTDSELLELADAAEPDAAVRPPRGPGTVEPQHGLPAAEGHCRSGAPAASSPAGEQPRRDGSNSPEMRAQMELARKKIQFLAERAPPCWSIPATKATAAPSSSNRPRVPGAPLPIARPGPAGASLAYDKDAPKITPQIVLAKEHYNRLVRMCEQGEKLKMVVDLAVQFHDDDLMAYNTVAEIPGTDLKDEVVMLGGHMDSWHSGTGATDNGAGVSVAMEAVRILKAST